jgi:hypothetical protein
VVVTVAVAVAVTEAAVVTVAVTDRDGSVAGLVIVPACVPFAGRVGKGAWRWAVGSSVY